ncbi:MAG: DNA mismatch repair protein MutS [Candidatus Margulisiibacteriota bacterium]
MSETPMMIQYKSIKKKHQDSILFFRLGDFYEMFFDDAAIASSVLGLTLTGRGKDENRIPMCGVHAAEAYISKLVRAGYKVAICEQVELASESKGPTKRAVVRIVTPGTAQLEPVLDATKSNYLAAISSCRGVFGLAFVDISTGEFFCDVYESLTIVSAELHRLGVSELLLDDKLTGQVNASVITPFFPYEISQAEDYICQHFKIKSLTVFKIEQNTASFPAIVALLDYLSYTQKGAFSQVNKIQAIANDDRCFFDSGVTEHLDLFDKFNGLFKQINFTATAMGARALRHYIRYPLIDLAEINLRQKQVEAVIRNDALNQWQLLVKEMNDIERVLSRICSRFKNPKDMLGLANSLKHLDLIDQFIHQLGASFNQYSTQLNALISAPDGVNELKALLTSALNDEVPSHVRDGGIFQTTYSNDLMQLCQSFSDVRQWMNQLEPKLKNDLDIKSLKVGFNKVFGYYIEIPNSQKDKVPENFIRKQTLTNAERYITPELKEKETILLNAQSQQAELEKQLFDELERHVERYIEPLQALAKIIAHVDVMISLGESALRFGFSKPTIKEVGNKELLLDGLWHPMVAENQKSPFIRNTLSLPELNPFMLITGPNMAGKSTVMRSVAICIILGQMGSFVPANSASFGLVTAIFTRIGANDKLSDGQSTFMVEMIETATICQNANEHSLILLDEVGRGTSTFDGVSIAAAVTEYIVSHIKARTLFATHYHELTALSKKYSQIQNASMQIKELDDQLVFAYKLIQGAAEKSYGVMVAKMAGLPKEIIDQADAWLNQFEQKSANGEIVQLQLF